MAAEPQRMLGQTCAAQLLSPPPSRTKHIGPEPFASSRQACRNPSSNRYQASRLLLSAVLSNLHNVMDVWRVAARSTCTFYGSHPSAAPIRMQHIHLTGSTTRSVSVPLILMEMGMSP